MHNSLAITLSHQGRNGEALGHARQALKSYTAADDRPGQAQALNSVGWLSAVVGDHQQALSHCEQSLDLFRDLGFAEGEASALDSLGYAHQQVGQHAEATVCYRQAIELHRQAGSRWAAADALGHLGDTCHAAGKAEEARVSWEEALVILEDLRHPQADQIRAKLRDCGAGRARGYWWAGRSTVPQMTGSNLVGVAGQGLGLLLGCQLDLGRRLR